MLIQLCQGFDEETQREMRLKRKEIGISQPYSKRSQCARMAHEYCSNTSLHGVPWVARSEWPAGARPFWMAIVALGIALCIYMSHILWLRVEQNPTIYVVETINYPTVKIPFPSVMICNNHQVYEPKTKNIHKLLLNTGFNESQIKLFFFKNLGTNHKGFLPDNFKMIEVMEQHGYDYIHIFKSVHQPCTKMLIRCAWRNVEIDCSSMFHSSLGLNGYCCRFNSKYFWNNTKHLELNYIAGFGEKQGLSLDLNISNHKDFDRNAERNYAEIRVFNRDLTLRTIKVHEGQQVNLAINPSLHSATERVRMMAPDKRQCGYVEEPVIDIDDVRLRRSYEGCVYHYYVLYLLERCNCVPLFAAEFDPSTGWDKFPICNHVHNKCLIESEDFSVLFTKLAERGHCLAACDDIDYGIETDYTNIDIELKTNLSKLNIYFQNRRCTKYTREETISPFQMFAAFGGVFGLCLGGNVISVIEFLWFIIKLISVVICRYKPSNDSLKDRSNKIKQSSVDDECTKSSNMLYVNELLPYGYSENAQFVLPEIIN